MTPDAAYFDQWYAAMNASLRDEIAQRALGLPPELESTSLLSWDGIAEVCDVLQLAPGDTFVDLACGRGGYGLEIAHRTGASLIGVDFSEVAVARAAERTRERAYGDGSSAQFRVGELTGTGLPDGEVDAVLCIDAMHFAEPFADGITECLRILRPGGRLVLTGWEPIEGAAEELPERLRRDIGATLRDAGFEDVVLRDMPRWREIERHYWLDAVAAETQGDPALQSLHDEGERALVWLDRSRRLLVSGRKPEPS